MDIQTILLSGGVGIVTSAVTAYFTTKLRMKEERDQWSKAMAVKITEAQTANPDQFRDLSVQFAVGLLIYTDPLSNERERVFIPPHCRLDVGRDGHIAIEDSGLSRRHFAFRSDASTVYLEDLHSSNGTFLNGKLLTHSSRLASGDIIRAGVTEIVFQQLGTS